MVIQKGIAMPYLMLQHTTLLLLPTTQLAFTPQFTIMLLLCIMLLATKLQFTTLPFTMLLFIMPQLTKSLPMKLRFTNTDMPQLMIILE